MSRIKIGLVILLAVLIAIQFFQPARNQTVQASKTSISTVVNVPNKVQAVLEKSCYDCHSNNTRYPWYARLQPGAWWMASHIEEGKAELNFDEFGAYSKRRKLSKLKAIQGSVEDGSMPLPSYTFIHRGSGLSKSDQKLVENWIEISRNEISNNYE